MGFGNWSAHYWINHLCPGDVLSSFCTTRDHRAAPAPLSCHSSRASPVNREPQAPPSNHWIISVKKSGWITKPIKDAKKKPQPCRIVVVQVMAWLSLFYGFLPSFGAHAAATCCSTAGAFQIVVWQWKMAQLPVWVLENQVLTMLCWKPLL